MPSNNVQAHRKMDYAGRATFEAGAIAPASKFPYSPIIIRYFWILANALSRIPKACAS